MTAFRWLLALVFLAGAVRFGMRHETVPAVLFCLMAGLFGWAGLRRRVDR